MAPPGTTDGIGFLLSETARAWRGRLDERLKPLGLSQAKWRVLVHLATGGDGMIQRELASRIGIEGPTLVVLLDRMTRDGWILRRDSNEDRRCKKVYLTAQAQDILKQIRAIAAQLQRELLAQIPKAELQTCVSVLQQIKERAENL